MYDGVVVRKRRQSKLIDFGMAVFGNRANEIFKSQGGTTEFMAPEVSEYT